MTNKQKYPIGTKIRFLWKVQDTGKVGTIVSLDYGDTPIIYLPDGRKIHKLRDGTPYTWRCQWHEIELVAQKNEQLLFDFMY